MNPRRAKKFEPVSPRPVIRVLGSFPPRLAHSRTRARAAVVERMASPRGFASAAADQWRRDARVVGAPFDAGPRADAAATGGGGGTRPGMFAFGMKGARVPGEAKVPAGGAGAAAWDYVAGAPSILGAIPSFVVALVAASLCVVVAAAILWSALRVARFVSARVRDVALTAGAAVERFEECVGRSATLGIARVVIATASAVTRAVEGAEDLVSRAFFPLPAADDGGGDGGDPGRALGDAIGAAVARGIGVEGGGDGDGKRAREEAWRTIAEALASSSSRPNDDGAAAAAFTASFVEACELSFATTTTKSARTTTTAEKNEQTRGGINLKSGVDATTPGRASPSSSESSNENENPAAAATPAGTSGAPPPPPATPAAMSPPEVVEVEDAVPETPTAWTRGANGKGNASRPQTPGSWLKSWRRSFTPRSASARRRKGAAEKEPPTPAPSTAVKTQRERLAAARAARKGKEKDRSDAAAAAAAARESPNGVPSGASVPASASASASDPLMSSFAETLTAVASPPPPAPIAESPEPPPAPIAESPEPAETPSPSQWGVMPFFRGAAASASAMGSILSAASTADEKQLKIMDMAIRMRETLSKERANEIAEKNLSLSEMMLRLKRANVDIKGDANDIAAAANDIAAAALEGAAEDRAKTEASRALRETRAALADDFYAGLVVIFLASAVGGWRRAADAIAGIAGACPASSSAGGSWMWSYLTGGASGPLDYTLCVIRSLVGAAWGAALLALLGWKLLRYNVVTSFQSAPATVLLLVLGGGVGVVGKNAVSSLGGDGETWVRLWHGYCVLAAMSHWGASHVAGLMKRLGSVGSVAFHVALGGVIPFVVGAAPFDDVFAGIAREAMENVLGRTVAAT